MSIKTFASVGAATLLLLLCGPPAPQAASDPAAACKQRKSKAAGKKAADALKALGKNATKPDETKLSESLSKADSKFSKAFVKAEAKGGCQKTGDAASIGLRVDIFAAQANCAMTSNCEGKSGGAGGGDSRTTDTESCIPPCDGLNCVTPCDGATPTDVIETTVSSPNAGPTSIAEFEFPALQDIRVQIEAPQADSALNPLHVLFMLDGSLFSALDNIRMQLVRVFRDGTQVPNCDGPAGVASPDPCVSQRQIVGDDLQITVLTTNASTWTFDQLPFGPAGAEFQVNTYTTSKQSYAGQGPQVAFDGSGNFVVVWNSKHQDGNYFGVFGQRFDSTGTPQGVEFQVNTYTTDEQRSAAVAVATSGDFVVVWQSYGQDGDGWGIFGQRFDSSGTPVGSEFQVNTYTTGSQGSYWGRGLAVAAGAAGDFVVVWYSYGSSGQDGDGGGVFGQRFDSSGTPLGSEFQVNTYTTGDQGGASIVGGVALTADPAGNFVVVWPSYGQDSDGYGIFGQRYDNAGTPLGSEFQVNTYTTGDQGGTDGGALAVAAGSAGDFVVAWASDSQDGDGNGVFGQRFDGSGTPLGSEFQVNTYTTGDQGGSNVGYGGGVSVAADPAGNFVVAWQNFSAQDGDYYGIFGQRFDTSGTPQGAEFQINTYTTSYQQLPAVAADGNARFVVVWDSYGQDGDRDGIFAQRFVTK